MPERLLLLVLLLCAGCGRERPPDATLSINDQRSDVLDMLDRLGARDVTDGLSLGYDPNASRDPNDLSTEWHMWMLDRPKCGIETTFVDGTLAHLLFWDFRDREVDRYFAMMAHDELSSLDIWITQDRFEALVVTHHDGG